MDKNQRIVSTYEMFPLIIEALEQGHKVKFTVSGTSMLPWIRDNRDQVILRGVKGRTIKIGDIVLFRTETSDYILHRIYKKEGTQYHTIGDSCCIEDGLIKGEDILGIVETIFRKEKVIDCNSNLWKLVFFLWRKSLPIRGYLMRFYFRLVKLKRSWINKSNREYIWIK